MANHKNRIFSGIQPTGNLHLGNYLGAIRNWVQMQNQPETETLFCLVDLHAITIWQEPSQLRNNVLDMASVLLACGIDQKKSILFVQSANPHHSELCWLLASVARIGWLERMTQFKEKTGKHKENASAGLYIYPILMAADILLYHANHVPVGADQTQHLELARDIAQKFNHDYEMLDFFPLPETKLQHIATRVMSLRDGTKKMSKSDISDMSRILLTDNDDVIADKIKRAKTDSEPLPDNLQALDARAEVKNLLSIYSAITDKTLQATIDEWAGKDFARFKPALSAALIDHIAPIRNEIQKIRSDETTLKQILNQGAVQANAISTPILEKVREIMGLENPPQS